MSSAARGRRARARSSSTPALQGFDLLDGQAEPLVAFAIESGWPVYVRTGTPPHALPLQVAWLAARFPEGSFLLGKSGATDFSHDGPATLAAAPNVYADSVYVEWPTALAAADPEGRGGRVFFSTDAPFGDPAIELARVTEAPYGDDVRDAILGGTLAAPARPVIGLRAGRSRRRPLVAPRRRPRRGRADRRAARGGRPAGARRDADVHLRQRDVRPGHAGPHRRARRGLPATAGRAALGAPDLLRRGDRERAPPSCSRATSAPARPPSTARSTGSRPPAASCSCSASATRRTRRCTSASSTRTRRISTSRSTRPGRRTAPTASRAAAARSACSSGLCASAARSATARSAARSPSSCPAAR